MIKGAGSGDGDYVSKARGWLHDNIEGKEDKKDFGKAVAAGAAGGAAVGGVLGMAKAIKDANDAQFDKVETKVPIYQDKLKGVNQHAEPDQNAGGQGTGMWKITYSPVVKQEQVGDYNKVEYKAPTVWGTFVSGFVGMSIGAIGGGLLAAGIKVLRDLILSKE